MVNIDLPFDLEKATAHLSACDPCLAKLIEELLPFDPEIDHTQSPYEALMQAIVYQSISGKAAATIFARIKALSDANRAQPLSGADGVAALNGNGRVPTPEEVLKFSKQKLRKAG